MKKLKLIPLSFFILLSNLASTQTDSFSLEIFGIDELQVDFTYWRNRIEQKHPLVYLYHPKSEIDQCFDSLYQQINKPMTELEFIKLLTPAVAIIQDGHNYVLPSKATVDSVRNYKYLFPFEIKCIADRFYITQDLSTSDASLTGLEITAINGVQSNDILQKLISNLRRDGNNNQYAYDAINKHFRFYFHIYFGCSKDYLITYRTKSNEVGAYKIMGSSLPAIQKVKLEQYHQSENISSSGMGLTVIDTLHTAVLSITTFSPGISNHRFKHEIVNYFEVITSNDIHHFIIDLRDNGGGNPNLVKFVLQHFFDQPFKQAGECRIVNNTDRYLFSERTKSKWYPWYGIGAFKPKKNNFSGNLYVLVNEGTYSAGVICASVLRNNNRAVFVGTETGGNPIIMAGYLIKTAWELPNTKIQVGPGNLCTIYGDLSLNKGNGLIPDYIIEPTIDDILSGADIQLNYTLQLIRAKK